MQFTDVLDAMAHIVTYNWDDENADYLTDDGNDKSHHIFLDLQRVRNFLEATARWDSE